MSTKVTKSWYQKLVPLISASVATAVIALSTGCGTTTKYLEFKELERVEKAKKALDDNEEARKEAGRHFVYSTEKALEKVPDPESNEVKLAKLMNERALLTLGTPKSQEALKLQRMIDDLLAMNEDLQRRGKNTLAQQDAKIAHLENRSELLESNVNREEKRRDENFQDAQLKAEKWDDENSFLNSINPFRDLGKFLKKMFFLLLVLCLIAAGLKIGALFFPPLAPFAAIVDIFLGGITKGIVKVAPKAQEAAGLVAKATYDTTREALKKTVIAVQDIRYDNGPDVKAKADAALSKHHNDATIAAVRQLKQEEGID